MKTLTVSELISQLQSYPSETQVFIASDEEGNAYGTLDEDSIMKSAEIEAEFDGLIIFPCETFTDDLIQKSYDSPEGSPSASSTDPSFRPEWLPLLGVSGKKHAAS